MPGAECAGATQHRPCAKARAKHTRHGRWKNLTPRPPSLRGKGEKSQNLTPWPPSLRGKGEKEGSARSNGAEDSEPSLLSAPSLLGKGRKAASGVRSQLPAGSLPPTHGPSSAW